MNSDPTLRVRPETRNRVLEAARNLSYTPNFRGRALRVGRTGALALVVPEVTNPVFAAVVKGAADAAAARGYYVLLGDADDAAMQQERYHQLTNEGRIDGVLLQRGNTIDDSGLARLLDISVPTVLVNSELPVHRGSVRLDDSAAIGVAVKHLTDLGHTMLGHLGGPGTADWASRRRDAFVAAVRDAGLLPQPLWVQAGGIDEESARDVALKLLLLEPRPTALTVSNIRAAIGVLTAAKELGLHVPSDLSVVAINDAWFARHTDPPLTTIAMPLYQMGLRAVEILVAAIDGTMPANEVVRTPEPELVRRASTGIA